MAMDVRRNGDESRTKVQRMLDESRMAMTQWIDVSGDATLQICSDGGQ
jgi:hypothetical protein